MNFLQDTSISPLQLGLVIAGVLLLVALIVWNGWNARRNTPKQADAELFSQAPPPGAERGPDRLDPVFDSMAAETVVLRDLGPRPPSPIAGAANAADAAAAAVAADTALPAAATAAAAARQAGAVRGMLDPLIDVIAPIALDAPLDGETLLRALPPSRRVGSKPFAIEGLPDGSDDHAAAAEAGPWQVPRAGERYRALQAGVQMANRTGALNEIEFSEFVVKTQTFADAVGGACEFPEMLHEVARARELDQFASDHDAQLGLHVHARGAAWSPGYVRQHAARLGFVPGSIPGRLVLPADDAGAPPVLTLSFDAQAAMAEDPTQAALREVRVSLDVPQVPRSAQPFAKLREVAAALAGAMDGVVTDERGQRLPPAALQQIESEVERLYDQLDGRDLAAGSALARRVFS